MRLRKYDDQVRQNVGLSLLTAKRRSQVVTAQVLRVSTRTLRSWKRRAKLKEALPKCGRPKKAAKLVEVKAIVREWKRQGYAGAEAVFRGLEGARLRLVRQVVALLKERRARRAKQHRLANRTTVEVNKAGVLLVIDAAKKPDQDGGELIVTRDRGSLKIETRVSDQAATCAADTLSLLKKLKKEGGLPYVLGNDNGSPFVAHEVVHFLNENNVIQLKSLPHVPQQNGSAENAVGEVKRLIRAGLNCAQACSILNDCRKRASLNWKTATEIELEENEKCSDTERVRFYHACKAAINLALLGMKTAYEMRKAEREAVFQTLEAFNLITRHRGHRPA
jgi:transposase InsO family protein